MKRFDGSTQTPEYANFGYFKVGVRNIAHAKCQRVSIGTLSLMQLRAHSIKGTARRRSRIAAAILGISTIQCK